MKTTIDLPTEQVAALEAQATREARPTADIVRDALDRYLADHRHPLPPGAGIFDHRETDADDPNRRVARNGRRMPDDAGTHADDEVDSADVDESLRGRLGWPKPEAVGIFSDLEVDSTNIDDWLRANWRPE